MIFIIYDLYLCIRSLSCTLHIKMFLAPPSRVPGNIVFLVASNVSNLWTVVYTQVARIPTIRPVAFVKLRFENNAHGDKTLNRPLAVCGNAAKLEDRTKEIFTFVKKSYCSEIQIGCIPTDVQFVFWFVLMFLIFEQLCKHKSHVFR